MSRHPDSPLVESFHPSPNHGERRGGKKPDSIILHYTGMTTGAIALRRLCDAASEVSSHYLVEEDGRILQLVAEERRAWHAGASSWRGETDMNSASIGIEIVNPGHEGGSPPYPAVQIEAVASLCRDIAARHGIAPERVLAHSDIAPGRKRDPGEYFPWKRLHATGVGHWIEPTPPSSSNGLAEGDSGPAVEALRAALARYGYGIAPGDRFDSNMREVIRAFQRHFRPAQVDGVADDSTIATLKRLIATSPGKKTTPASV